MRHGLFVSLLLSTSFAVADSTTEPNSANVSWSQWRGPSRDGKVPGSDWSDSLAGLEREWRVPLGKGYPGPIVADGRVFVVESDRQEAVIVRALDVASGREAQLEEIHERRVLRHRLQVPVLREEAAGAPRDAGLHWAGAVGLSRRWGSCSSCRARRCRGSRWPERAPRGRGASGRGCGSGAHGWRCPMPARRRP